MQKGKLLRKLMATAAAIVSSFLIASTTQGHAAISYFEAHGLLYASPTSRITVYQGTSSTIRVNGHGTDLAQAIAISGTRVSGRIVARKNGLQHQHYKTKVPLGEVSIRVSASTNAALGTRVVTIKYPVGQDRFHITIARKPAASSVDVSGRRVSYGKLAAPFKNPGAFSSPIGVDHSRGKQGSQPWECKSYLNRPFPTCYNFHTGTDFMMIGGYTRMALGSVDVIATAAGIVVDVRETQFDHCFADPIKGQINCQGRVAKSHPANFVVIKQNDGLYAGYYHLKKDSVPSQIRKGRRVQCGQILGKVGSSGTSSYPHLHFHLSKDQDHNDRAKDRFVDPYAVGLWRSLNRNRVPNGGCPS